MIISTKKGKVMHIHKTTRTSATTEADVPKLNLVHKACRTRAPPAALSVGCGWRLAAHVGSGREPRVRINSARIWPRAAVRQISVVFNIFRLVHPMAHHGCVVCEGRQVCSEKQYDTGQ